MKTRLSEKMNAMWPIKKFLETFEKKKLPVEKFRFQADLTISKFLTFLIFEASFCLQMDLKNFLRTF